MSARIVVFGATGYTGEHTARELVAQGARPVLAGRSPSGSSTWPTTSAGWSPGSPTSTGRRPWPTCSTRGCAAVHGRAVHAVGWPGGGGGGRARRLVPGLDRRAGVHPARVRAVRARVRAAAGTGLVPAFGYDWVPGNLAGALALAAAGAEAVRIDIGYYARGPGGSAEAPGEHRPGRARSRFRLPRWPAADRADRRACPRVHSGQRQAPGRHQRRCLGALRAAAAASDAARSESGPGSGGAVDPGGAVRHRAAQRRDARAGARPGSPRWHTTRSRAPQRP